MGTLEFTVPDEVEEQFRQRAVIRFGHGRKSIEKAGKEAISKWIAEQNIDGITPSQNPLLTKRGVSAMSRWRASNFKNRWVSY